MHCQYDMHDPVHSALFCFRLCLLHDMKGKLFEIPWHTLESYKPARERVHKSACLYDRRSHTAMPYGGCVCVGVHTYTPTIGHGCMTPAIIKKHTFEC